ncbi:MAG TPA: hypothetical protein VF021_05390 [Longimicrobiales bacterium]
MIALCLAATLALTAPDSTKSAGGPRRVVAIQDTVRAEDLRDRWLAEDKLKHFTMSYGITVFAYAGARSFAGHDGSIALAIGAGGAAGILKELYDRAHARPFSLRDLLWDAGGVAVGYAMIKNTR